MWMKKRIGSIAPRVSWRQFFILATLTIMMMGCTAHRAMKTYDYVATAQVAINEARYTGADTIAPELLNEAELLLATAKKELNNDDFERARRSAQKAKTLAELAAIKANAIGSNQELETLQTEIAKIQSM